jgi:hypothetical protein
VCQFVLSAEAPGTNSKPLVLPANIYCGGMDIRQPLSSGTTFGVAYVVSELGCLATDITFSHDSTACFTKIAFPVRLRQ